LLFIFCATTSIVAIDIKSKLKFNLLSKLKTGEKENGRKSENSSIRDE
jgi:hypothetical protein